MQAIAEEERSCPRRSADKSDLQLSSRHFCADARHLSAQRTASDESWSWQQGLQLRSTFRFARKVGMTFHTVELLSEGILRRVRTGRGSLDLSIRQMFK